MWSACNYTWVMNHLIMKQNYNTDLTFAFYQRGYLKNIDTLIREATIMHEPKPSMTSYVMFILRKCSSECAKSNAVYNLIYSERQKKNPLHNVHKHFLLPILPIDIQYFHVLFRDHWINLHHQEIYKNHFGGFQRPLYLKYWLIKKLNKFVRHSLNI